MLLEEQTDEKLETIKFSKASISAILDDEVDPHYFINVYYAAKVMDISPSTVMDTQFRHNGTIVRRVQGKQIFRIDWLKCHESS